MNNEPSSALVLARKLTQWGIAAFPLGSNHARAMTWKLDEEVPSWAMNDEPGDASW